MNAPLFCDGVLLAVVEVGPKFRERGNAIEFAIRGPIPSVAMVEHDIQRLEPARLILWLDTYYGAPVIRATGSTQALRDAYLGVSADADEKRERPQRTELADRYRREIPDRILHYTS